MNKDQQEIVKMLIKGIKSLGNIADDHTKAVKILAKRVDNLEKTVKALLDGKR